MARNNPIIVIAYNQYRGSVSYDWNGVTGTIKVKAKPANGYLLRRIQINCPLQEEEAEDYNTPNEQTLESAGHTECSRIEVSVVFVEYEGDDAYLEVLTLVGSGEGFVWPASRLYAFTPGTAHAQVSIHAVPAEGYKFVRWDRPGSDWTSTSADASFGVDVSQVSPGATGSRTYYAHFERASYNYKLGVRYCVTGDSVTKRETSGFGSESATPDAMGRRRLRLYYRGILNNKDGTPSGYRDKNTFAYLVGAPFKYEQGDRVAVSLEIEDQTLWELLGLRAVWWSVLENDPSGQRLEQPDAGGSIMFDATHVPRSSGSDGYSVTVTLATDDVHRLELLCKPDDAAELYIYGKSYSVSTSPSTRGIGARAVYAASGDLLDLRVVSIILPEFGFVHGWSANLPDSANASSYYIASKEFTMPDHDAQVTVFFCNHRLLYGASSKLLYGSQNKLLCNCSVPPGTTVYD